MAGIRIPIGGDLGPLREAIEKIRGHFRRLSSQIAAALRPLRAVAASVFRGMATAAKAAARSIAGAFAGLKSSLGLGGLIGGAGLGLLAGASLKSGSDLAADIERSRIALTALTGSGAEADRMLAAMRATWEATGVTIAEQEGTIRKFIALGFAPKDAMRLQSNILDIAGAVGLASHEAELLGSALAQVKAKGIVSMEELRQQIAEKGVPVFEALASRLGVTQAKLMKLVEDGKVPAEELLAVFMNLEGSFARFRGGAVMMGGTFAGMVARMKGVWKMLLADFAEPINNALKPMLEAAMVAMNGLKARAKELGQAVGDAFLGAFALIRSGRTMELLGKGMKLAFVSAVDVLYRGLQGTLAFLATALPPILDAAFAKVRDPRFWLGVKDLLVSAGKSMASSILEAMGKTEDALQARLSSEGYQMRADSYLRNAGQVDFTAILIQALKDGGKAFTEQFKGESKAVREARDGLRRMFQQVANEVSAMKARYGQPNRPPQVGSVSNTAGGGLLPGPREGFLLAGSMARIGGGGFGMTLFPLEKEQQKTNATLSKIEKNTRGGGGKNAALYD